MAVLVAGCNIAFAQWKYAHFNLINVSVIFVNYFNQPQALLPLGLTKRVWSAARKFDIANTDENKWNLQEFVSEDENLFNWDPIFLNLPFTMIVWVFYNSCELTEECLPAPPPISNLAIQK